MSWSSSTHIRAATTIGAGICLGVAIAGCGADDRPAAAVRVDAAADGSLRFERRLARATPGPVAIQMANPAAIPHAIAIRGAGLAAGGETVAGGGTSRLDVDLKPGTYELFCPVGAHEQAGMVAKLIVGS